MPLAQLAVGSLPVLADQKGDGRLPVLEAEQPWGWRSGSVSGARSFKSNTILLDIKLNIVQINSKASRFKGADNQNYSRGPYNLMKDRLENLNKVFNPKSIAFIGATDDMGKWGFIIFNNILCGGFEGKLYPVNPSREKVQGLEAYPSIQDIPGEVDLAVFTVPAPQVLEAIDDCIAKNVKAGVIISAGFKEVGGVRADLEFEMVARARAGGMILVGPNGQGVICPAHNLYSWMPLFYPPSGKVAVISQSGNIQSLIIDRMLSAGFGSSKGVSSGNEADLKTEDYLDYLAGDAETEVVISYVEGVIDGRRFFEAAQKVTEEKPLVILQGGRTKSGQRAATSHTGAMAVSDDLFQAGCRQSGITSVRTINDAGIVAASFINRPLPQGKRIGIITGGGGLGVIASDICTDEGLEVVIFSPDTLKKIGEMMPDWWVPGNPIDMVGAFQFTAFRAIIEIIVKSGEIDAVLLLLMGPSGQAAPPPKNSKGIDMSGAWDKMTDEVFSQIKSLHDLMMESRIPFYPIANQIETMPIEGNEKRMMVYRTIDSACRTISAMANYTEYRKRKEL